jgi:hypothetical protein
MHTIFAEKHQKNKQQTDFCKPPAAVIPTSHLLLYPQSSNTLLEPHKLTAAAYDASHQHCHAIQCGTLCLPHHSPIPEQDPAELTDTCLEKLKRCIARKSREARQTQLLVRMSLSTSPD